MNRMESMVNDMLNFQKDNLQGNTFDSKGNRTGVDGGHSNVKMQQIGNVFYNLLGMIGETRGDSKLIGVSNDLRDMI